MRAASLSLTAIAAACLAGCGAAATPASVAPAAGSPPQAGAEQPQAGAAALAPKAAGLVAPVTAAASGDIAAGTPPGAAIERSVDASYTVPPGHFLASFQGVVAEAVSLGGWVAGSATYPDSHGRIVGGAVTLKVPAADIAALLDGLPAGLVASSIDFASIDHTADFVDVTARLTAARAHLAALDALLAKATSLSDIATLEDDIAGVETDIDTDQGQLDSLTSSVQYATVSINLRERGVTPAPAPVPSPITSGVGGGWSNATAVTGAILDGLTTSLPLLVLALLALGVWRLLPRGVLQRRQRRAAE